MAQPLGKQSETALKRQSGVLLHLTSLPGRLGSGDLGPDAYRFVDWLVAAGQSVWQVLPLGGIGAGNSPYMSASAFAGNELLISMEFLFRDGLLDPWDLVPPAGFAADRVDYDRVKPFRMALLAKAARRFAEQKPKAGWTAFSAFCKASDAWLDDYALFMVFFQDFDEALWHQWPTGLAQRQPEALAKARADHAERIFYWKFCQWKFHDQWAALHRHATESGIRIFGDVPIFVSENSADVWANPGLFKLNRDGSPAVISGVPPDYFSTTGQRWGNPLYDWEAHRAQGYRWWIDRVRHALSVVDILRIDHFRGLLAHWEIPAHAESAVDGAWVAGPGADFLRAVQAALPGRQLVAEDLGVISNDVTDLRRAFDIPGMAVLQFAWDGKPDNPFLPHNLQQDMVVYAGTHDNDTTLGWWFELSDHDRHQVRVYFGCDGSDIVRDFLRAALHSPPELAVIAMQDILCLPGHARMNRPGVPRGNWEWRFGWDELTEERSAFVAQETRASGRARTDDGAGQKGRIAA